MNMGHVETIQTKEYVNGIEIPETETVLTANYKNSAGVHRRSSKRKLIEAEKIDKKLDDEIRDYSSDESFGTNEDTYSSEEIDKTNKIIVDNVLFEKCLKKSMKHQVS